MKFTTKNQSGSQLHIAVSKSGQADLFFLIPECHCLYLELAEKEEIPQGSATRCANIAATDLEKYKVYLMVSKFNQSFRDKVQDF